MPVLPTVAWRRAAHSATCSSCRATIRESLQATVVIDRPALEKLQEEWNELVAACRWGSVFLTWEWIAAWLDTIDPGAALMVVLVRDGEGRLAGIGPFYRSRLTFLKVMSHSWLRILGDSRSGSEYGMILARPDVESEAICAVFGFLSQHGRWDGWWLPNVGPADEAAKQLQNAAQSHGLRVRSREAEFARIHLPDSYDDYVGSLAAKVRTQMRGGVRRMEEHYQARLASCERVEQIDPLLEDLFRLHQMRWTQRGEGGIFAGEPMREFYRALCRRMLHRGWLRLDTLQVEGRAVAAQIGFCFRGNFYELQRGFDPAFPNIPAGLGAALRCMVLRRSIGENLKVYDFLGECTDDKQRAGAHRMVGHDWMLIRPSVWNSLLVKFETWPTGRFLRFPSNQY